MRVWPTWNFSTPLDGNVPYSYSSVANFILRNVHLNMAFHLRYNIDHKHTVTRLVTISFDLHSGDNPKDLNLKYWQTISVRFFLPIY